MRLAQAHELSPLTTSSQSALGERIARRILLLDPDAPGGYVREWSPPGLATRRGISHMPFSGGVLPLVLLVLYFGLNFRKVS